MEDYDSDDSCLAYDLVLQDLLEDNDDDDEDLSPSVPARRRSCKKEYKFDPLQSTWYKMYLENPNLNNKMLKVFRTRFRLPYDEFVKLKEKIQEETEFERWLPGKKDHFGVPSSPIGLLLLGTLRYLGRGWTFDDIEEATAISRECHRQFFHKFVKYGATTLYEKHVVQYLSESNLASDSVDYGVAGFPGAVGSLDATHIITDRCKMSSVIAHKGFKMSQSSRTYNITVNHRRKIISSTKGNPGSWNDKSVVKFDKLAMSIKNDRAYDHFSFHLYERCERSPNGVRKQKYNSAWFIVDNGYQPWSIFVPPYKHNETPDAVQWSHMIKSVRTDVECTFGILKGCWRILKAGVQLHGANICDDVFLTCCALHNLLLEKDGLNEGWQNGVRSDWEGSLGNFDPDDIPESMRHEILPNAHQLEHLDTTRLGQNNPFNERHTTSDDEDEEFDGVDPSQRNKKDENGNYTVGNLTLECFRCKLIEHFSIAYQKRVVHWPRANKKQKS